MAENKEEHKEENKEGGVKIRLPKMNLWILVSLVLAILLVLSLIKGWSITGKAVGVLSAQDAAQKAVDWISSYYKAQGVDINITLLNASEQNGAYQFTVELSALQGNAEETYYVSKDGKVFFPQSISIEELIKPSNNTNNQGEDIPKTDKPVVQLFVMSFCPYGMQAEQIMKPVVDLLGTKASIEPHFIVSVSGTTVNSLHGEYEAKEDMRQACVWKYYGQTTFWKYVDYINSNCDRNNIDTCWKSAATNASIDVSKIETCVNDEGVDLMTAEDELSGQNGVTGSPTLLINGVKYSGARTAEAYKQAICSAFTTPPAECSQTLSSTGSTASGGCQ